MTETSIDPDRLAALQDVTEVLAAQFPGLGFALLVFPFSADRARGRLTYASNANDEDVLVVMKEFIADSEGRMFAAPETKQ